MLLVIENDSQSIAAFDAAPKHSVTQTSRP